MIKEMSVSDKKNLKPSLEDITLITQKDVQIEKMEEIVNKETFGVMSGTAKKVLARFWRHIVTAEAETQTEFNLVESLKDQISRLELIIEEREAVFVNMK